MPANEKAKVHLYSASVPWNHSQTVEEADTLIPIVIHRAAVVLCLADKPSAVLVSQLLRDTESCLFCPQWMHIQST